MRAVCHDGMGGFGNGAGNETGAEPDDAGKPTGALDVIFGVGGAEAVGCLGTGGASLETMTRTMTTLVETRSTT